MFNLLKTAVLFVVILLSPIVNFTKPVDDGGVKIMTSILPLADFARAVCGRHGKVEMLLPPGAEVHTWKPRPSDIVKLADIDLFLYIGADLEPWINDILGSINNPDLQIVEASKGMTFAAREAEHPHAEAEHKSRHVSVIDPHIWLDFEYDLTIIDLIKENLIRILPDKKSKFTANAEAYKKKLKGLDMKYRNTLEDCSIRTLVLGGHAAFGYLAKKYQLRMISLYGLSPDSKPSPKKLMEIVKLAKKYSIEVIFFEANVSGELASTLAAEIGAKTSVLNPGANLTKKEREAGITFIDIMENNLEKIKHGLICK